MAIPRNEIISIISNFYTFLTTHPFLPASAIKTPPPEGWPPEPYYKIGKSSSVIDLLSHLPYIDHADWYGSTTPSPSITPVL
jgi:hypothetical protein